jgi:adenosylmethionine-8-amino-7-oxononanoate aminotransferase
MQQADYVGGDNIGLCPPLVIDGAEINAMFDMLARAL